MNPEKQAFFEEEDLARTFIRIEEKDGSWSSKSLAELIEAGEVVKIYEWFGNQIASMTGMDRKTEITDEQITVNICRVLEALNGPLHKIKDVA